MFTITLNSNNNKTTIYKAK